MCNSDKFTNNGFGFWTKRQVETAFGAEKIGHYRVFAAFDSIEEKRWATLSDHAAMNLSDFEVRINLGFNCYDLIFSGELVEECAEA
jgi:hypothetical protein